MNHHLPLFYQPVINPQSSPLTTSRFNKPIDLFPMFSKFRRWAHTPEKAYIYMKSPHIYLYIYSVYIYIYTQLHINHHEQSSFGKSLFKSSVFKSPTLDS